MNKALRFVWLSLLTLICGVASAGTVVFDAATDVSSGRTLTKNGITLEVTQGTTTFDAVEKNGNKCYNFTQATYFNITPQAPAGNLKSVIFEYDDADGYVYDRNYYCTYAELGYGVSFTETRDAGADALKFAIFSGSVYVKKITVEYFGDDPGTGGDEAPEYTIADLLSGAADVATASVKFTDAQVVYANGSDYVVRENGKAIDLINTSLSLELGATLNGKVTLSVAYNSGILKATDIDGVTNADDLTQTNATYAMNPATATPGTLGNYKGDLVKLEQVTIYKDSYNDFGLGANAYFIQNGYSLSAYLVNAADFSDKITNTTDKYDLVAWYNAPGQGMIGATLQIVSVLGGEEETAPAAPVISGDATFDTSTLVTITAEDGAEVYYTTDGSTPTEWSVKYTNPFTLYETTTVKAIAKKGSLSSDVAETTFTKNEAVEGTTIAELAASGQSQSNVTLKLNNAKVVYADGNSYVVREDGKAIDFLNTSLSLQQGAYLTGTVKVNVDYNQGIITTSDIDGETNANALTINAGASQEVDAIDCPLSEVKQHPGDVVTVANQTVWQYSDTWYFYDGQNYSSIYLSNGNDYSLTEMKQYTATLWFNGIEWGDPLTKIVEIEQVVTSLDAPYIAGDEVFSESTTVTISAENIATIHYTLDGTEPTAESPVYTEPLTLTETTTVKAIATYKAVASAVATKTFSKKDLNAPMTIADIAACKMNFDEVTVKFNNAQVVYAENDSYILREDGYALNVLNTTLPFAQGSTVTGTVKLKVSFAPYTQYNNGILTTADLADVTNADDLTVTAGTSTDMLPLEVAVSDVSAHPGDLLLVKKASGWNSYNGTMFYAYNPYLEVYLSNGADYNIVNNGQYDATIWYNNVSNGRVEAKIINCKKVLTYLDQPTVNGNREFYEDTEVSIVSEEGATIYYTLDGTDPTTESTVYTGPFTISESCTLKTFATYEDLTSSILEVVFTKKDLADAFTIAQLAEAAESKDNVLVYLKNAKVVYGEGNATGSTFILRDGGYALDVVNSSLSFPVNAQLSGTVRLKVTYEKGLLTATDIENVTNSYDISFAWPETYEQSPLTVDLSEVKQHPGDLLRLEGVEVWSYDGVTTAYTYEPSYVQVKLSNAEELNLESGFYNLTVWYNDVSSTFYTATAKVIDAQRVEKKLDAPVITGEENFVGKTTVTITENNGYNVFYTLDGTEPTRESTVYTDPFVITETTTVKAVTSYNDEYSEVVSKTFTKTGDYETKTIAELHEGQQSVNNAYVSLNNAKVVYAETREDGTHVAILREDGKALDVVSGILDLPLGSTVSGKFFADFAYNGGVVAAYDVQGETDSYDLEYTMPGEDAKADPIETTVADVANYPGDLVLIKGLKVLGTDDKFYGYTEDYQFVNLTDNEALAETEPDQLYDVLGWFNAPGTGLADGNASLQVIALDAQDVTEYNDQTIAQLNVRTDRENNIRLHLDNAKVVYVRENPYTGANDIAIRQDGKAIELHGTLLPLELNSTVSGTVKMNFYGASGIPQLRDIDAGITNADDLEITPAASEELDPTEADFNNINEHKADLVILRKVQIGYGESAPYVVKKDGQTINFVNENEELDVDALVSDTDEYDVVLWYNSYENESPKLEIVKATKLEGSGIYGVDANYGENGNTYNLQGVKVNKNYRGVVIRDGKKFTQK